MFYLWPGPDVPYDAFKGIRPEIQGLQPFFILDPKKFPARREVYENLRWALLLPSTQTVVPGVTNTGSLTGIPPMKENGRKESV